jgi:hypothetical protein
MNHSLWWIMAHSAMNSSISAGCSAPHAGTVLSGYCATRLQGYKAALFKGDV